MLKKMFSVASPVVCLFSLGCGAVSNYRTPVYPDKNLKEIVIYGTYYPADKQAFEDIRKELIKNAKCDRNYERCRGRKLNEGETLEEALKNRFSGYKKEGFGYSQYREYCYNETEEKNKKPVFRKDLRARLYDKEGNLLTEDFLRLEGTLSKSKNVISYLPYHDKGYKFRIVSLKGNKEVILNEIEIYTQAELREITRSVQNDNIRQEDWAYNEERECHINI